jgi:uncharacterized protein YqeY
MLKQTLEQDLKQALLSGDKKKATTLKWLKSVILYAELDQGKREVGLDDETIISLLSKEANKCQQNADIYRREGNEDRAIAELAEKVIIEKYLPQQLSDEELSKLAEEVMESMRLTSAQDMGRAIGLVKDKAKGRADTARIAQVVKQKLS